MQLNIGQMQKVNLPATLLRDKIGCDELLTHLAEKFKKFAVD
jgi:hypothetical protein